MKGGCICNKSIEKCLWHILLGFPSNNSARECLSNKEEYKYHLEQIKKIILSQIKGKEVFFDSQCEKIIDQIKRTMNNINRWPNSCDIYITLNIPELKQATTIDQDKIFE